MARKKTAIEKLNVDKQPKIVSPIPEGFPGSTHAHSMVVSTPREVDSIIRRIPEGHLATADGIRTFLARQYHTDIACSVSTGIFINVVGHAAEEMRAQGTATITPYWRVLKVGGKLNEKYPGGTAQQQALLEAEGFRVQLRKGGYFVEDYEEFLFTFDAL